MMGYRKTNFLVSVFFAIYPYVDQDFLQLLINGIFSFENLFHLCSQTKNVRIFYLEIRSGLLLNDFVRK